MFGVIPTTLSAIPSGVAGTLATAAKMRALVHRATTQPAVVAAAQRIADAGGTGYQPLAQALAIRAWLGAHVRFTHDPTDQETLWSPDVLLERIARERVVPMDCDDAAMLAATLLRAIGLPAQFVLVDFTGTGAQYQHVYTEALIGDRVVEYDVTRPRGAPIPPGTVERRIGV